jgi:hypothetical protein
VDANSVVDQFEIQLSAVIAESGWQLWRWPTGHSDRKFKLSNEAGNSLTFTAKLSQSSPGFWGLGVEKAAQMIEPAPESLVLLSGEDHGYFINPVRLRALIPKFGKDAQNHDYKINEAKIRRERHFNSLEELWSILGAQFRNEVAD